MKAMTFGSSVLMSGLCLVATMACTALPEAKKAPAQTWQARLKAVEDSLCSVTNLVVVDAKTGLVRVDDLPDPDSYEVRALRIFETVLNAECRQMLGDELAKIKGTVFIFR